jgi:hypothetical protein
MWRDNDVPSHHGEAVKHIAMVVYNLATSEDAEKIKSAA